ncbi:PucR family transcriptional regulator [Robertmurraya sp. P23]|uniref:PucR family transcriptional regulator n=1 Tax=Robertmurraya sp. P23 TaxID=3436931 RepID=UPI003D98C679
MKSYITVGDLLQRNHFEDIEILAGEEGLIRPVKWVHIVEVTNIRNLLRGGEFILSTCALLHDNNELFLSVVEQLIEVHASGLCIELGTYTTHIPNEVIELCNLHQFPLLIFHNEVPFVEITQDIHTLLINRQYQMISELESYTQELNKKLLTFGHTKEILQFTKEYLQIQVMIVFNNQEIQFSPDVKVSDKKKFIHIIHSERNQGTDLAPQTMTKVPIHILGDTYAELYLIAENRTLTEFDHLILDRTATALAQLLLRQLYVEEKKRIEESEWLTSWLDGEHSEDAIHDYLAYHFPKIKPKGAFVCQFKLGAISDFSMLDITYFNLYVRAFFEPQGFTLFSIEKKHTITFIFVNERNTSTWKARMKEGIQRLEKSDIKMANQTSPFVLGVGKFVTQLSHVHESYLTSLETIRIQDRLTVPSQSHFYDDLHIFRLISLLNKHINLQEIVMEYLEPVLTYDDMYNGKLLETLKTYLACNGSKQETAKRLFIVRQTLYHRIEKLEKLLGEDFLHHEKRLAIEFMILSHEFLLSSQLKKEKGVPQLFPNEGKM